MKKTDLGLDNDLYDYSPYGADYSTDFKVQAFAENGKAVLIFSETPQNYTDPELRPVGHNFAGAVQETMMDLGINAKNLNNVEVIYHQPENVKGNNPESFQKVDFHYAANASQDPNAGPDQSSSLRENLSGRDLLAAEEVAEKVGPENFVEKQFAREPTFQEEVAPEQEATPHFGPDISSESAANSSTLRNIAEDHKTNNPHEYDPDF